MLTVFICSLVTTALLCALIGAIAAAFYQARGSIAAAMTGDPLRPVLRPVFRSMEGPLPA